MEERNVTVDRDNGGSLAAFSLVAVLVVVALIGLFVWQPWSGSTTTQQHSVNQTVTQPGTNGTTGSSGSTTNGSSTTTTTSGSQ